MQTAICIRKVGGYRLNTDFDEVKMDLGRMFGFAWREGKRSRIFPHGGDVCKCTVPERFCGGRI